MHATCLFSLACGFPGLSSAFYVRECFSPTQDARNPLVLSLYLSSSSSTSSRHSFILPRSPVRLLFSSRRRRLPSATTLLVLRFQGQFRWTRDRFGSGLQLLSLAAPTFRNGQDRTGLVRNRLLYSLEGCGGGSVAVVRC